MRYEWRDSNGQKYLYVKADSHYDLGLCTGKGLVEQIEFIRMAIQGMAEMFKMDITKFQKIANLYLPYIPQQYVDEITGITDGVNEISEMQFTLKDIQFQALFLNILHGQITPSLPPGQSLIPQGCTAFGAINDDGSIVLGQNYDADGRLQPAHSWVLHELADDPLVFSHRLGAILGIPMAKNEHGLIFTVNLVQSNVKAPIMVPRFVLVREALAKCKTAEEAYKTLFSEEKFPFSLNLLIGDREKIIAVQVHPEQIRPVYVKKTIVQSNQYDYIDWVQYLRNPTYSQERQIYAEQKLAEIYATNTRITNDDLLNILRDSPIICRDQGGGIGTTVAFMTKESFGVGTAKDAIGKLPI
ncbi:MAG: C45 family autoproteolytic acyltransferase/hydrolase [Candidatus Hermodarchaeota archaeon]